MKELIIAIAAIVGAGVVYAGRKKQTVTAPVTSLENLLSDGWGFPQTSNIWDAHSPLPSPLIQALPSQFETLGTKLTDTDYLYELSQKPPLSAGSAATGTGAQFVTKKWVTPKVGEMAPNNKGTGLIKVTKDGTKYDAWFRGAEIKYGIPQGVMSRLAWQESKYDPNAVSPLGAIGLMQIMPKTFYDYQKQFGNEMMAKTLADLRDPQKAIYTSALILKKGYGYVQPASARSWPAAIVVYNQGPPPVNSAIAAKGPVPLEWAEWFKEKGYTDGYGYFNIAVDTGLVPAALASTVKNINNIA